MLAAKSVVTAAEKGYNREELVWLKRTWPPSIGCGHGRTEALEEAKVAEEEEASTASSVKREAACDWDEKSITKREEKVF